MKNMDREPQYKEKIQPHDLAKSFESAIKSKVSERFPTSSEDLSLLLDDEEGAYMSQEDPDTLCCFVVDRKNGFLYLVTGRFDIDRKQLENLKADIVS
jgi:hypothetical protein